ncbi:MAG: MarR family transcriptional regulator [Syntrophomonadaceae bacterium]|nr:MarR family transcriptional regulator [Syntrophomonadaceae bacterium]
MDHEKAKEVHTVLLTFMGLFHEKFLLNFRRQDGFVPRLNKNQIKIMGILQQQDKLTATEIGKMLDIEKGSLTTLTDQLEAFGFVKRAVDPDDRRRVLLSLSDAGRARIEKVMAQYIISIKELFRDVDPGELEEFINSINYAVNFMKKL